MAALPLLWRFADRFVPREVLGDTDETDRLRRMRLLVLSIFALLPLAFAGGWRMLAAGGVVAPWLAVLPIPVLLICLALLRLTRSSRIAGTAFCLTLLCFIVLFSAADHGLRTPAAMWIIPLPLFAAFLVGWRAALVLAGVTISAIGGMYALEVWGIYQPPSITDTAYQTQGALIAIISAIVAVTGIAWLYEGYTLLRLRGMNAELRALRADLQKSEEEYRSLFENIPTGAYRSTPGGQIVMANRALMKMLGVSDIRGLDSIDAASLYVDPEGRRKLLQDLDEQGELHGAEYELITRRGGSLTVRESAHTVRDENGRVLFYEGIIEDISAQRAAEEETRRIEERHRALVQHSTDVITLVNASGVIEYQSPSITSCLGYQQDETEGLSVVDLIHPEDQRRIRAILRRAISLPSGMGTFRFRCRHNEGHYVYLEAVASNMLDNPAVRGFVVNSRDVTEQKRAEVALIRSKEHAEEVARLKSGFLANMSHEIRTPLTGIIGFAGVLSEEVTDQHREFVELIELSGRRLLQTLNSVLDLARLEADQMEVELCQVDVCQHVEETVQLLQPIAVEKGIKLSVETPSEEAISRLDSGCMSRILNNLVGNALKFTDEGEVRVQIEIDEDLVHIHVADTGIGIDEQFLPHLFEEFKQESTGLQRQHEGSGLGLTITRRLVELMQGTIQVASEKGVGSTFSVTLPLIHRTATIVAPTPISSVPKVLVVDDNESTLALMRHIIGHVASVDIAQDQATALGLVQQSSGDPYDLIFMDIHLGGAATGTEVMQQIRQNAHYGKTRIIAFTAFALPGDRERFINAGFSGYLGKPFTRQEVLEFIEEIAQDRSARGDGGTTDGPPAAEIELPLEATFISS